MSVNFLNICFHSKLLPLKFDTLLVRRRISTLRNGHMVNRRHESGRWKLKGESL